ncbi:methyltransferase-domain-containing protein [Ochromonadaceae sp. CCMP2298]|nr:methyltransferase-domain-containing protein [Ochromonadaceae sp. CCMP2298]
MNDSSASASASSTERPVAGLSSLQQKFAKKLEGARFRTINETLYTSTGQNAFDSFQRDPIQFDIYHAGFREQSRQWPYNPLHGIVAWLRAKGGKGGKKLRIADMGCGDAELAASLSDVHTVHSFDLVSRNSRVVASDIAHVPLREGSVDVVVFCLALMGTNVPDFVREAHRILAVRGSLRIAEVRSRFDGDGISIKKFEKFLKRAGFDIVQEDFSKLPGGVAQGGGGGGGGHNKMFFEVECTKSDRQSFIQEDFCVRPCVYKKR